MGLPLGGRPALPGVIHGRMPVAGPALQLGELVPELGDRSLHAVRRGITQELVERPAGLVQAIGELEELSHNVACSQDMGFEFALHVPLQGDPAIEQLLIDPASEEELDEWIRLERFGHHPWFLQLLGQLQSCASVPFRCREVSPEQPGVPEVLLDPCPQREIVPRLAPSSLEHGPGPPPPFGLGEGLPQVQQHAGPSRPGHREVHRLLQDAPRQRGVPALVVSHARLVGPTHQVLASVPGRGAAGHLPELGRGLRGSPGKGQQGGLLECGGDGDVRATPGVDAWRREIRADLQVHTTYSDGSVPLEGMVEAAAARGHAYVAITDHSVGLPIANGMSEERLAGQGEHIDRLTADLESTGAGIRALKSIEMNLSPEGEGDMDPEALARLDLVLGAFHAKLRLTEDQTARYLAAIRNPTVHVLARPRCRMYNRRAGLRAEWDRVFAEAASLGKAVEIDANPHRQDLDPALLETAREAGVLISIGTDAHSVGELDFLEYGLAAAIRGAIPRERILNFRPVGEVTAWAEEVRRA